MNIVDSRSQAGESPSIGVGLSNVYAGFRAKVGKSIFIIEVQSRGTARMGGTMKRKPSMDREPKPAPFAVGTRLRYVPAPMQFLVPIAPAWLPAPQAQNKMLNLVVSMTS